MTDFFADCVTDFCIFLSYKSARKSFGVTYALEFDDYLKKYSLKTNTIFQITNSIAIMIRQ